MKSLDGGKHRHKHKPCAVPKNISVFVSDEIFPKSYRIVLLNNRISRIVFLKNIINRHAGGKRVKFFHSRPKVIKILFVLVKIGNKLLADMKFLCSFESACKSLRIKLPDKNRSVKLSVIAVICYGVALMLLNLAYNILTLNHGLCRKIHSIIRHIIVTAAFGTYISTLKFLKATHT